MIVSGSGTSKRRANGFPGGSQEIQYECARGYAPVGNSARCFRRIGERIPGIWGRKGSVAQLMHLYPINGAAHRPRKDDTPWSYRDAVWSEVIVGVDPDPAKKEAITEWAKDYWKALHPYGAGGAYVNFMMDGEGEDRIRATYRDNYERLARIKAKYDPTNFFR